MDYLEVYVCNKHNNISFNDHDFHDMLRNVTGVFKKKKYALFRKQVLKVFHDDIILESTYDDITTQPTKENAFSLTEKIIDDKSLYTRVSKENTIIKYFSKIIKPLHNFPSTTKIYDEVFENKTIFKINNRLYLNFSQVTYKSDTTKKYNYIYINYNSSDKCDIKMNINTINEIIESLLA